MPCCVPGCRSGLSGHLFPTDKELFDAWAKAINRPDWAPTKHTSVCILHFKPEDYNTNKARSKEGATERKRLKRGVVPSVFGLTPNTPSPSTVSTRSKNRQDAGTPGSSADKQTPTKTPTSAKSKEKSNTSGMRSILKTPVQAPSPTPSTSGTSQSLKLKIELKRSDVDGVTQASVKTEAKTPPVVKPATVKPVIVKPAPQMIQPNVEVDPHRWPPDLNIPLSELLSVLTCSMCKAYLYNAMTITECFHTFCRKCILDHVEKSLQCPKCNVTIHPSNPYINLRPDVIMQEIVYKILPDIEKEEKEKEMEFYKSRGIEWPPKEPKVKEDEEEETAPADKSSKKLKTTIPYTRLLSVELECIGAAPDVKHSELMRRFVRIPNTTTIQCVQNYLIKKLLLTDQVRVVIFVGRYLLNETTTVGDVYRIFYHDPRLQNDEELTILHYGIIPNDYILSEPVITIPSDDDEDDVSDMDYDDYEYDSYYGNSADNSFLISDNSCYGDISYNDSVAKGDNSVVDKETGDNGDANSADDCVIVVGDDNSSGVQDSISANIDKYSSDKNSSVNLEHTDTKSVILCDQDSNSINPKNNDEINCSSPANFLTKDRRSIHFDNDSNRLNFDDKDSYSINLENDDSNSMNFGDNDRKSANLGEDSSRGANFVEDSSRGANFGNESSRGANFGDDSSRGANFGDDGSRGANIGDNVSRSVNICSDDARGANIDDNVSGEAEFDTNDSRGPILGVSDSRGPNISDSVSHGVNLDNNDSNSMDFRDNTNKLNIDMSDKPDFDMTSEGAGGSEAGSKFSAPNDEELMALWTNSCDGEDNYSLRSSEAGEIGMDCQ